MQSPPTKATMPRKTTNINRHILCLCLCIRRDLFTLDSQRRNQLALASHGHDLLKDEENDEDIANRVLLQVLLHDTHKLFHLWGGHCANG
eukprot:Skav227849  [mRNA]  locus=scaffold4698:125555:125824:+ [translate_table: standard]